MYQNSYRSLYMVYRFAPLFAISLLALLFSTQPSWSEDEPAAQATAFPPTIAKQREGTAPQQYQDLIALLHRHKLEVQETPHTVIVTLPTTLFEFTAVELTNAARVQLRHIAAALTSSRVDPQLAITGVAPETAALQCNQTLSIQGAESVAFALEAAGIGRQQMHLLQQRYPAPAVVPCCPVKEPNSTPALKDFRVEIHIAK